jgi:prophage regulatory protein
MSERFLRLAKVQRRIPYSRSSIYLKVSRGEFPPPIDLGARAVAWLESDVDEWIESRIAKSRDVAPVARAWAGRKEHAQRSA